MSRLASSPRSLADLGEPWRDHPVLRADFPRYRDVVAWEREDALVLAVTSGERGQRALIGLGEPAALVHAITQVVGDAESAEQVGADSLAVVSLTRGAWTRLPVSIRRALAVPQASHWNWMMSTSAPPRHPGEDGVTELDPLTHRAAMADLQSVALPNSYTSLDKPATRWFGWHDTSGVLRCMAAASNWDAEVHLGSIATHPDFRRRGLGTAVTARVSRLGLAATGQVSLALYADNHDARRVYERLGFALVQEWESRRPAS
ncbi:GNAT family N-acetyltransferase [Ruania alba]|uniref:FR47-like protein n=1 Tax=Ruania alba TaxID=648782 RepID=A0A1H5FRA2_9MICO|nr:GNAT family N-acetyltransferase [Ruania alba]SEE05939.1 FR47-like protein [Ruania alba]